MMITKKDIQIGSVSAQGYVIRNATIFIGSSDDIGNPQSLVEVKIIADLVWANKADGWSHNDTELKVDIDNEKFLAQGKPIEVINGKEIFRKIMRVLVGSLKS